MIAVAHGEGGFERLLEGVDVHHPAEDGGPEASAGSASQASCVEIEPRRLNFVPRGGMQRFVCRCLRAMLSGTASADLERRRRS